jgi:phage/plasmid-like protein (TIGR03299 family)
MKTTTSYTEIGEAIAAFGLNFEVEKSPLYINKGGLQKIGGKVATVRTDTKKVLGIVGESYEIVQNSDQFGVFQEFADKGIISFENGGIFDDGARTYIQAVLPETIEVNIDRGDVIRKFITLCSSHDGSLALQAFVTPTRIVCTNTFQYAIQNGEHKVKIKHTKTAQEKLEQAIDTIQKALDIYKGFDEFISASLRTKEYNEKETEKFVELILPSKGKEISTRTKNMRIELLETIHSGIGQAEIPANNLYKLFNGVTCYTNNVLPAKGKGEKNPFEFVTFATGNTLNSHAWNVANNVLKNDMILV